MKKTSLEKSLETLANVAHRFAEKYNLYETDKKLSNTSEDDKQKKFTLVEVQRPISSCCMLSKGMISFVFEDGKEEQLDNCWNFVIEKRNCHK